MSAALAQVPKVGAGCALALLLVSVIAMLAPPPATAAGNQVLDLFASLALMPGHTLLGEHYFWNVLTFAFIESNPIKLMLSLLMVLGLAHFAESRPSSDPASASPRVLIVALLAVALAGACVSLGYLMAYMSWADEAYLYKPLYGAGPLAAALAICAHHAAGEQPALPGFAPWLPVSALPLLVLVVEALSQFVFRLSRAFVPTAIAAGVAWVYLRFYHRFSSGAVGDSRPSFEFLSLVPGPAQ